MPPAGVGAGRLQARSTRPCPPGTAKLAPPSPSRQHERPSGRPAIIFFLLCFALFCKKRASNVQCTLCCYMAPYMSDLVLCCDGLGGMCRENSFIFFWPCATTNEESAAVRSGTMLYLSCLLPCMWAHVQWGMCLAPHFDT